VSLKNLKKLDRERGGEGYSDFDTFPSFFVKTNAKIRFRINKR